MPKVTGISLGVSEVRVVELEGSARRYQITRAFTAPLDSGEMDQDAAGAEEGRGTERGRARALAQILKEGGVQRDQVAMVVSGRDYLIRNATLPIKSEDQIRKVIKFEAESWFQSVDIEDVVVDFYPLKVTEDGTDLLAAAVRKKSLGNLLERAEASGADPEIVNLDSVAIFNAASALGCIDGEKCQLLLDLGRASTRLLLCREGRLVGIRSQRFGLDDLIDHDSGEEDEGEVRPPAPSPEVEEQYARRVGREVARFLARFGLGITVDSCLATGPAGSLPGVRRALERELDRQVEEIGIEGRMEHTLEEEELEACGHSLLAPLGAAIQLLGGARVEMNFRQEEYQYSRKFERIKFPLAVCLMFLAFLLVLNFVYMKKQEDAYRIIYDKVVVPWVKSAWLDTSFEKRSDLVKWERGAERLEDPLRKLRFTRNELVEYQRELESDLGFYPGLPPLESGLHVLRFFAHVFEGARKGIAEKVLVTSIQLRLDPAARRSRYLEFDLIIWGENARSALASIKSAFKAECGAPGSPFASAEIGRSEDLTKPPGGFKYRGNRILLVESIRPVEEFPPR